MDIKKDVQASDLINLITEKIEFLKSIGIKTQDNLKKEDRVFQVEVKEHLINELEILRTVTVERKHKGLNVHIFMMTQSIIKQIETLATIASFQDSNRYDKVDIMVQEFIRCIKNEAEILHKINLLYVNKNEKEYKFAEELNDMVVKQSDTLIKIIQYNSEKKDKEADKEFNKLLQLYESEDKILEMIDKEFDEA